jgi:hypothetical protein
MGGRDVGAEKIIRTYIPCDGRGNGTPIEDDGGIELTADLKWIWDRWISTSAKKYHSMTYTPRAAADRSIGSRTMGVGLTLSTAIEKKYPCRTSTPHARAGGRALLHPAEDHHHTLADGHARQAEFVMPAMG